MKLHEAITKHDYRGGIYSIICLSNNRLYIGSADNILDRLKEHNRSLANNKHHNLEMQLDYNKYGKDMFIIKVNKFVHHGYNREQLYKDEQAYLDTIKHISNNYYNKSLSCRKVKQPVIDKPVKHFINNIVDPYNCIYKTIDTITIDGSTKTYIAYTTIDNTKHYEIIEHN